METERCASAASLTVMLGIEDVSLFAFWMQLSLRLNVSNKRTATYALMKLPFEETTRSLLVVGFDINMTFSFVLIKLIE